MSHSQRETLCATAFSNTPWESAPWRSGHSAQSLLVLPRSFQRPCFQRRGGGWTSGFVGSQVVLMCYVAGSPCLNTTIILSSKSFSCLWAQWEPESSPGSSLKRSWRGFSETLSLHVAVWRCFTVAVFPSNPIIFKLTFQSFQKTWKKKPF